MAIINILDEINDFEKMRIHAIELKMVLGTGRQIELQTFECGLLVPIHRNFGMAYSSESPVAFPITIHTNKGDIAGEIGRF